MDSSYCSLPVTGCDELWFEDGNLVLQVQNAQYKVHRSLIADRSDFLRDMLALFPTDGTEAAPLFLHDVYEEDFTLLMRLLYSQWGDDLKFTPDDWMCVVRVAHSLQFTSVLRVAMDKCEDEDADMKLLWAEDLGITEWKVPARRAAVLAFDVTPATSPEYWPIWLKISRAREAVARARLAYIQQCIKLRAARNNAQPICQHAIAALAFALPRTPRKNIMIAFDKAMDMGSACKEQSTKFDEPSLLTWLPKEEAEFKTIDESWFQMVAISGSCSSQIMLFISS